MNRLGELDLPDRFAPRVPAIVTQIFVALGCTVLAFVARAGADLFLPAAGPFALTFPSVLLATLFARWQAGMMTQIMCALYAWYAVLPFQGSFAFQVDSDGPRVVINVISGFLIVILAEIFRRAVRRAVAERVDALAKRDLYLQEFDHRVKNNFGMVVSLLELQRRELDDGDPAAEVLGSASMRVDSFARAHQSLYRGDGLPTMVDMQAYMTEMCDNLAVSLTLPPGVAFTCEADRIWFPRDRAIAVGLIVNELATNAAKYAFEGRENGSIHVEFTRNASGGICLAMSDDGIGTTVAPVRKGGLGQRLIQAFAAQAKGEMTVTTSAGGTKFVLELEAEENAELTA
ncbi:MAG: histidine kinase dimerization/phosphoacceptor domain -containing protein [Pacificimonas sp.]